MSSSNDGSNSSAGNGPCGNPECSNAGQKKCSGCSKIFYCSASCQKKHWADHKQHCKPAKTSNSAPVSPKSSSDDVPAKLMAEKTEIQKSFNSGDFATVLKRTEEALVLAKKLPPSSSVPEVVQLHVNASSANLHLNNMEEAVNQANAAVLTAEIAVAERPGQPQPIELLTVALGGKIVALITSGQVDSALELAERCVALAESIYPKNDPRLHKSLRALGLTLEKKGDQAGAEKAFLRGYTILSISVGVQCVEAQMLIEDLCNLCVRRGDLEAAERHVRKHHKAMSEKTLQGRELAMFADSAARLANLIMRKGAGGEAEAEELVQTALDIREKMQPPQPMGIAVALCQLASIREILGRDRVESEGLLLRALDIFGRTRGSSSPEVVNTLAQLRALRAKMPQHQGDEELLRGEETSSSSRRPSPLAAPLRSGNKASGVVTDEDRARMDALARDDAAGKMTLAGQFFEQEKFTCAELVLSDCVALFTKTHGPDHNNTKAATQNLMVVRNQRIQQLWMEVVTEELGNLDLGGAGKGSKGAENAADDAEEDEFSQLMSGKKKGQSTAGLTPEEQLFLNSANSEDSSSKSSCCIS